MKKKHIIIIGLFLALFLVMFDGFYTVDETEQVIITQFGAPVGEAVVDPGLKMKIPFIQKVNRFEKRFLEWDGDQNQVPTKDKKFIFVDSYARWHITDPLQFFQRMRDERGAQSRLDDILDGETRNAVASHDLVELVRTSNREPDVEGEIYEVIEDSLETIEVGRNAIQDIVLELANERTSDLGIAVLDFRFKRINYVEDVQRTVYDRMISERNKIADLFRSEGQGEASRIEGEKERELLEIQSVAFRQAREIRGRGDAEAASIYNEAYNRNSTTRELYDFIKAMEAYETSFDGNTSIFLSTDSDFFKYLKSID
ncbi:protease modulator HflC [Rhodohalobacter sulfatireducens]|uniref:Protein HflC n=1 Tax=Rhodohalobacter sulfatireducens TaxID=2911366 RepID=A0ABS9KED1_9BACT|nr:protease modulator HflC [Rhodohalobacter sulfatireducens]MCG2589211.1 protease modulator HflC [Rhodohalobacter sulfatireducens]